MNYSYLYVVIIFIGFIVLLTSADLTQLLTILSFLSRIQADWHTKDKVGFIDFMTLMLEGLNYIQDGD